MAPEPIDEKAAYNIARRIESPEARADYLEQVCGDNPEMMQRVIELLRVHDEEQSFLESPPPGLDPAATIDQPVPEGPGTVIGPYKLLQKIGEGGFGVVYMADQKEPVKRRVALKIIKPGMDTRQVIARFEAERQALAMMDHPNIAKVLDAGTTESGRPYFVMELVKGVPITRYCDEKHLTPRERLELFVPVCQALQHAHQKGVIHRDIKPTNVLVAKYDDRPVPKVIDFGVAKATEQQLTEKTMFTQFGQIVGTVDYMSPEQAELNQLDIDTRSDVYSLGVLLYELLIGETPFDRKRLRSAAFDELLRIIREEEPPKPSLRLTASESLQSIAANRQIEPKKLSTLFRGELDWIVMKALEKDRTRRYQTANGLANDIERYLNDEAVVACPPSAGYRFRKFARRNKAALTTASLIAAVLVLGLVGTAWQAVQAMREQERAMRAMRAAQLEQERAVQAREEAAQERDRATEAEEIARQERDLAQEQRDENRSLAFASDVALAQQAWKDGDPAQMIGRLKRHRPEAGQEDLRGFEWYYLWRLAQRSQMATSLDHDGGSIVESLAFSRRGGGLVAAISRDGVLKLWDVAAEEPRWEEPNAHTVGWCVAFSPDERLLATAGSRSGRTAHSEVKLWDAKTGNELYCIEESVHATKELAFSPDGNLLALATYGRVRLWDVGKFLECRNEGAPIPLLFLETEFRKDNTHLNSVTFAPSGNLLAFGDRKNDVTLCDLQTGQMAPVEGHDRLVLCLAFSPDGTALASGDLGGTVRIWDIPEDVSAATQRAVLHASTERIFDLAFSPDGQLASSSAWITLWDAATAERLGNIRGHSGFVHSLAFSPDGATLATGGGDGMVRLWSVEPDEEATVLEAETPVGGVAFSPDGVTVASRSLLGQVTLWDMLSGTKYQHLDAGLPGIPSTATVTPAFSPDGRLLACVSFGSIRFFDVMTGWEVKRLNEPEQGQRLRSVAFSPDGQTVATSNKASVLSLWNIRTGELERLGKHERPAELAFSPDGNTLAAAVQGGPVVLWDLSAGESSTIEGSRHFGEIAFSPDGSHLAWAGLDRTVELWEKATGEVYVLKGHGNHVSSLAFSRDGATLFSATEEGQIKIWDVATHRERATLRGHTRIVNCLAFSPDGTTLASGSGDRTVRLWRAAADDDPKELADRLRLESQIRAISRADLHELDETITSVETRLISNTNSGLSSYDLALAISTGRMLSTSGHHELAAEAYDRIAKVLTRAQGPKTQDLARSWETIFWQHRARLQMEQSQWEDAIASFDRAMALNPDDWRFPAQRGSAYAELGQWEEALVDFSKAIELGDVWSLRADRGNAFAMLGRWKDAADDFAVVAEHAAEDQHMMRGLAALQVQTGDMEAYKRTCRETFRLHSESHPRHQWRLVQICSLAPDCGIDRAKLTAVADRALAANDRLGLAKGMDDYRSGRYEQALTHLPPSGDAINLPLTLLFQAMAHHRLGHSEEARRLLGRGIAYFEENLASIDGPPLADYLPDRWLVWCIVDVVRREAEELIGGQTQEGSPKAPPEGEARN